ncbi:MAG: hypothetical protein WBC33_01065, partial [Conexibacter sp.]
MVADADLEAVLARSLAPPVRIRARDPWPYASSFPLEWLDVECAGGERRGLLWKDLTPSALLPGGRRARHGSVPDPVRELRAYELLEGAQLGTPRCYAVLHAPERTWLFLEAVDGTRLDEVGELEAWCAVARWLARAHVALTAWADGFDWPPPWRAPLLTGVPASAGGARGRRIAELAAPLAIACARVAALPAAVI